MVAAVTTVKVIKLRNGVVGFFRWAPKDVVGATICYNNHVGRQKMLRIVVKNTLGNESDLLWVYYRNKQYSASSLVVRVEVAESR